MSQPASLVEFDRAIKKKPPGKSPGPDNITYKFSQYGGLLRTSVDNPNIKSDDYITDIAKAISIAFLVKYRLSELAATTCV